MLLDSIKNKLRLIRNKKRFPNSIIESSSIDRSAIIGRNSKILKGAAIGSNVIIADNCMITSNVLVGADVTIDKYSYINPDTRILSGKIGKFCSVSYGCKIGMSEHPINYISTSPYTYGNSNFFNVPAYFNEYFSPPIIENDVWIGANVVILQGVTIGNGSIVAAGAIVNRDVPPYTIVGGVPAKILKKRFTDEQINYLNTLKWWDKSPDELLNLNSKFLQKEKWFSSGN